MPEFKYTLEQVDAALAKDGVEVDDRAMLLLYRAALTGDDSMSTGDLAEALGVDHCEALDITARLAEKCMISSV